MASYYLGKVNSVQVFSLLFPSENLRGWLNYISMEQKQTAVQNHTATGDVKTGLKRSNYY